MATCRGAAVIWARMAAETSLMIEELLSQASWFSMMVWTPMEPGVAASCWKMALESERVRM